MLILLMALGGCNDAGFGLVSISPIYGWTDGCGAITLAGHGFGSSLSASVGGSDITGLSQPADADLKGFQATGVVPAGKAGYADVVLRSDGAESRLGGVAGYYYVECPGPGTVDAVAPNTGLAAGTLVSVQGCGLDTAAVSARIVDAAGDTAAELPLISSCGKGTATFEAPALADGTWYLELVDASGVVLSGAPCGPADSADTGHSCIDHTLTYGSAE